MSVFDGALADLVDELNTLPGIGPKSAQRIAFFLLSAPPEDVGRLSAAMLAVKERVQFCEICGNISEAPTCRICNDSRRDTSMICVVEEPKDIVAIERTREYRGLYHVLGGAINPMGGIGPEQLRVRELLTRLADATVREVILATNPNVEGEATASFLARTLSSMEIPVSRLASGLPVGGDLEYADEITLGRALEGRTQMGGPRAAVAAQGEPT